MGDDTGAAFDPDAQLGSHDGWLFESEAPDEQINKALGAAAFHDSSLHMAPHKINAFDVQLAGTRRVMCAGCILRICFHFVAQLPRSCSAPQTDQVEKKAPIAIGAVQGGGGSCSVPVKRVRFPGS